MSNSNAINISSIEQIVIPSTLTTTLSSDTGIYVNKIIGFKY